jgi:hypothetical protein
MGKSYYSKSEYSRHYGTFIDIAYQIDEKGESIVCSPLLGMRI